MFVNSTATVTLIFHFYPVLDLYRPKWAEFDHSLFFLRWRNWELLGWPYSYVTQRAINWCLLHHLVMTRTQNWNFTKIISEILWTIKSLGENGSRWKTKWYFDWLPNQSTTQHHFGSIPMEFVIRQAVGLEKIVTLQPRNFQPNVHH